MEVMVRKHDKFGWDRMSGDMRQMIREDWLLALSPYPVDECRNACRIHTQEAPNKVPNEGHIKAIILREREKLVALQSKRENPLVKEPRVSGAAANEIIKTAGIGIKTFGEAK
jgi:hypothetical protein|tara:strand:+ start:1715 stop:2053 length:339 start_codon:yes stop_codon:yes gene_type:complete